MIKRAFFTVVTVSFVIALIATGAWASFAGGISELLSGIEDGAGAVSAFFSQFSR